MIHFESLVNLILAVKALIQEGHKEISISGEPHQLADLGIQLNNCAISATTSQLICKVDSDSFLKILELKKLRNGN